MSSFAALMAVAFGSAEIRIMYMSMLSVGVGRAIPAWRYIDRLEAELMFIKSVMVREAVPGARGVN